MILQKCRERGVWVDIKTAWSVLMDDPVEGGRRVIFRSADKRSLLDITVEADSAGDFVREVISKTWTPEELAEFLNSNGIMV